MSKTLVLHDCNVARAESLYAEIGKVRCWLSGFAAGRSMPGQANLNGGLPGEDALRQMQIILKEAIAKAGTQ